MFITIVNNSVQCTISFNCEINGSIFLFSDATVLLMVCQFTWLQALKTITCRVMIARLVTSGASVIISESRFSTKAELLSGFSGTHIRSFTKSLFKKKCLCVKKHVFCKQNVLLQASSSQLFQQWACLLKSRCVHCDTFGFF